jgi:hypothetical protein
VSAPGDAAAAISLGIDSLEHGPDVPLESLDVLGQAEGRGRRPSSHYGETAARTRRRQPGSGHFTGEALAGVDAGVTVLTGTDAAAAGCLADEIALPADFGMSPAGVLAAGSHPGGSLAGNTSELITPRIHARSALRERLTGGIDCAGHQAVSSSAWGGAMISMVGK